MEASTDVNRPGWTDGKPWEQLALGRTEMEATTVWTEQKTVGNSSGRARLGGSDILRSRAVGTGCQDKFHQRNGSEKLCAQDLSSGLKMLINVGRSDMRSFVGRERR